MPSSGKDARFRGESNFAWALNLRLRETGTPPKKNIFFWKIHEGIFQWEEPKTKLGVRRGKTEDVNFFFTTYMPNYSSKKISRKF